MKENLLSSAFIHTTCIRDSCKKQTLPTQNYGNWLPRTHSNMPPPRPDLIALKSLGLAVDMWRAHEAKLSFYSAWKGIWAICCLVSPNECIIEINIAWERKLERNHKQSPGYNLWISLWTQVWCCEGEVGREEETVNLRDLEVERAQRYRR